MSLGMKITGVHQSKVKKKKKSNIFENHQQKCCDDNRDKIWDYLSNNIVYFIFKSLSMTLTNQIWEHFCNKKLLLWNTWFLRLLCGGNEMWNGSQQLYSLWNVICGPHYSFLLQTTGCCGSHVWWRPTGGSLSSS